MQQEIIVGVVATVVGGIALAALSWLYAQRTGFYRRSQPIITWLNPRPWVTAGIVSFFVATLTSTIISSATSPKTEVQNFKDTMMTWTSGPPAVGPQIGGGDLKPAAMCPDGYYATGVNSWGSSTTTKYCIGCLNGIQMICRKLNVK